MAYELRVSGHKPEQYDAVEEAEKRVRTLIRDNADLQVDVIDLITGRPYAPAATEADRARLAGKVGF
jgi:hypothetical protein